MSKEAIDNTKPSEALECVDYIEYKLGDLRYECKRTNNHRCDDLFIQENTFTTIRQALLKAQEQEKENAELKRVLEILKPDLRLVGVFLQARMPLVEDNDRWIIVKEITDEKELDLLKKKLG